MHWGDFSVGVGGVVWRGDKVLLVQRAYNPGKGMWTIPGGYVDQTERTGDAVCREVAEETGIQTEAVSVIAVRDRPGIRHDIFIVYLLKDLGGIVQPQPEEVMKAGFFSADEYRNLPVAGLTMHMIEASRRSGGFTIQQDVQLLSKLAALYSL